MTACNFISISQSFQTNASLASQNTAQRVIDGVSYITEAVANVSIQPTKVLTSWVADQVAPTYWRPNNEIRHCHKCKLLFGTTDTKHHCRACGEGFCAGCSSKTKQVPLRNWYHPVRVCDTCFARDDNSNEELNESTEDVSARKVTEHVVSTLTAVGTVLNYSKCEWFSCFHTLLRIERITYFIADIHIVTSLSQYWG